MAKGNRGGKYNSVSATNVKGADKYIGKEVGNLYSDYKYGQEGRKKFAEDFGLSSLTDSQYTTMKQLFSDIEYYDYSGYGDNKKPYYFDRMEITVEDYYPTQQEKEDYKKLFGRYPAKPAIYVSITTSPHGDSSYINMLDTTDRAAFIGPNGGWYTYTKNGTKKNANKIMKFGRRLSNIG